VEHVDDQRGSPGEPAGATALAAEGWKCSRNLVIKFGTVFWREGSFGPTSDEAAGVIVAGGPRRSPSKRPSRVLAAGHVPVG
jgi:hypothetical protein